MPSGPEKPHLVQVVGWGGDQGRLPGGRAARLRLQRPVSRAQAVLRGAADVEERRQDTAVCVDCPRGVVPPGCPRAICLVPSSPSGRARAHAHPAAGTVTRCTHGLRSRPRHAQGSGAPAGVGLGPESPAGPGCASQGRPTLQFTRASVSSVWFHSCDRPGRWQGCDHCCLVEVGAEEPGTCPPVLSCPGQDGAFPLAGCVVCEACSMEGERWACPLQSAGHGWGWLLLSGGARVTGKGVRSLGRVRSSDPAR